MSKKKESVDLLSIAYVAIGARSAMDEIRKTGSEELKGKLETAIARYEGELGFIDQVNQYALVLEKTYQKGKYDLVGVFAYDVAEPFGIEIASLMILNPPKIDAETQAKQLLSEASYKGNAQITKGTL